MQGEDNQATLGVNHRSVHPKIYKSYSHNFVFKSPPRDVNYVNQY